jgi:hypothetical protein
MPFKSKAQNAWAHTPAGMKALGGKKAVKEWESATDYSHLPEHAPKPRKRGSSKRTRSGL